MIRKIILAAAAMAALSSAALAADINLTPQQNNHPYPAQTAGTSFSGVIVGGFASGNATAAGNLLTADSNGAITVGQASQYGRSQFNDTTGSQAQTATITANNAAFVGGGRLSATGIGNEADFKAAGYVTLNSFTQQNEGNQVGAASVTNSGFGASSAVNASAAANIQTASGYGVTLNNNGVAPTQQSVKSQSAGVIVNTVVTAGDFNAGAQAIANTAEFTALGGGININGSVQTNGFGGGVNGIAGYPGSSQSASLVFANNLSTGPVALSSGAFGNNLTADASFGGGINAAFSQSGLNVTQTASTAISNSGFAGAVTAGSTAIGNAASFRTH